MAVDVFKKYGLLIGAISALVGIVWLVSPEKIGMPDNSASIIIGIVLIGVGAYFIGQYDGQ